MYKSGRDKLSHLLDAPPCICGATARLLVNKSRKGTLAIIHDTHRHIDPQGWRNDWQVGTLQTEEIEQKMKVKVPSVEVEEDSYTVRVTDHPEHKNTLPNLQPASVHQMMALLNNAEQLVAAWSFRAADGGDALYDDDVNQPIHILRLLQIVHEEQMLYNALFYEVIRQCTVHCAERGHILSDLRRWYADLFSQIPSYLINIHNEMLVQRSIERRLAEVFIGYKQWWNATIFQFEKFKDVKPVIQRLREITDEASTPERLISLDESGQLFRQYSKLFAAQRASLEQDQQDMRFEKQIWQDVTYQLVGELVHDPQYSLFKSIHTAQTQWHTGAQQAYQAILLNDQRAILELRELTKRWLGSLGHLESRLLDYDKEMVKILEDVGDELQMCLDLFLARESLYDEELIGNVRGYFKKWNLGLNGILNKFKADESERNLKFLQQIHSDFETLVHRALSLLVTQYQREQDRGANLSRVRHETESVRILNATKPDYFAKHTSIEDNHFHRLSAAGLADFAQNSPLTDPENFPLELNDEEFATSVALFGKSARFQDVAKLKLLRDSQLYAGTYTIWKMYEAVRLIAENKIIGGTGIPLEVTQMEERFEHLRTLTANETYFIGAEPGRFHSAAYALLHQLKDLASRIRDPAYVLAKQAKYATTTIRRFINNARTWFLFCEGGMEARIQNILHDIEFISENMLRLELKLMTALVPDKGFEEERYQHLYKKQTEKTITDRLEQAVLQYTAVSREAGNLSRMLDEQTANVKLGPTTGTAPQKVIPWCENWNGIVLTLIDHAYRRNKVHRSDISALPLIKYLQKLRSMEEKNEKCFNVDDLYLLIENNENKRDFVELRLQGDEVNLYVKPFCLFMNERSANDTDENCVKKHLSKLTTDLKKQQIINGQIEKRVQDLHLAILEAKRSFDKNKTLAYYLGIDKPLKETVAPQFTDVAIDEMEALLKTTPPDALKQQAETDVLALRTLPSWEKLTCERGESAVDGPKRPFDFESRMIKLKNDLKESEEKLQNKRFLITPFIRNHDEQKQVLHKKRAEREASKVKRRQLGRNSRSRRRSRSSSVHNQG
ncbi:uncharacterized protein LOC129590066 isoform X2 [Paramacrobiotus metropolitanus]|nr:uncharacterized protein LOC129590066 isoform X2 [Paramacrobiotus metropolitanus]XP_055341020.1 uncharacterized protein LOC129590066 isoform X2 [Paramacrobiotus metropolitanus]